MNFNGIPLHPLVVHAVVVLTPLAALLAILFAVVPRWRWAIRWPLVLVAVVGAVASVLATLSGEDLAERLGFEDGDRIPPQIATLFETHEEWGERLRLLMIVLAVVAILAAYVMPFTSPLVGKGEREARIGLLRIPLAVVLVVLGVGVAYAAFKTGDSGAQMVWTGTPE